MSVPVISIPTDHLVRLGLRISDTIHYQLMPDELIRHCLRRKEGVLNDTGALVIRRGAKVSGAADNDPLDQVRRGLGPTMRPLIRLDHQRRRSRGERSRRTGTTGPEANENPRE